MKTPRDMSIYKEQATASRLAKKQWAEDNLKLDYADSPWCNCGLDNPEPKYHSIDCTYRVGWEDYKGCVHMLKSEVTIAEEVTGWKALSMKQYHPDFLDEIFMQITEDAYHYGKRKE